MAVTVNGDGGYGGGVNGDGATVNGDARCCGSGVDARDGGWTQETKDFGTARSEPVVTMDLWRTGDVRSVCFC